MSNHAMPPLQSQRLGSLLEEFVRERRYVPEQAQAIDALDELPLCLQALAPAAGEGAHWGAWSFEHRTWFVVAQQVRVPAEPARDVTLKISFYDHDGALAAVGVWSRSTAGHWSLHSVSDEGRAAAGNEPSARYRQFALAS